MRTFLYTSLTDHLKKLTDTEGNPVIKHIDLWNEQVEFIEQETPFANPAIFIEFMQFNWQTLGGNAQRCSPTIRFHIIQSYKGSEADGSIFRNDALERFTVLDAIDNHMKGFTAMTEDAMKTITMWQRSSSSTNHNHEELIEDITDYTCMLFDGLEQ